MSPDLTMKQVDVITAAFQQSQIQYEDKFLLLFSAYNAWYRSVTGEDRDAYALRAIKLRDVVWAEYERGVCFEALRPLMRRIALLTSLRPLRSNRSWSGKLDGPDDWEGLIEYWYAVRCDIVHANELMLKAYYPVIVKLAYESLSIFMTEVVARLRISAAVTYGADPLSFDMSAPRLDEVDLHPRKLFGQLKRKMYRKQQSLPSKHFTS